MALDYEIELYKKGYEYIVGLDEAGRGPLLGPVFAAAVILPKDFYDPLINDSKKLSEKQREKAFKIIIENALAYHIAFVSAEEIDKINILEASRKAFQICLDNINHSYDYVITDYMHIDSYGKPLDELVKGDARAISIAAASILAKVSRDHLMYELDEKYPLYGIAKHKGYGTKLHMEALEKYGPIKGVHRFSYAPVKKYTKN